jgi:hypothetical protein
MLYHVKSKESLLEKSFFGETQEPEKPFGARSIQTIIGEERKES